MQRNAQAIALYSSQVFFADIADFASITDALVPEDLVELLR